jgi:hypothetical protein
VKRPEIKDRWKRQAKGVYQNDVYLIRPDNPTWKTRFLWVMFSEKNRTDKPIRP